QETIASYQKILDEFSGTRSAERAIFFLGGLEYERENYTQAREYFSQYLKKYAQGKFALNAKESLAYIVEQDGDYQKAIEGFKALEKSVNESRKAEVQLAIARNYRSLDRKEEAMKIYQEIVDSSTTVSVKNQAREALDILESGQEFPPPSEIEESGPEAVPVEEAQPEASPVEETQPEAEADPVASPVEETQPEAEADPVASPVEETQPEAEADPVASPVEETQPEAEADPVASPVEETQPEAEAGPVEENAPADTTSEGTN
ncbi:MAG: tetratricopeptide repeat protein, partial [bacterium]|nr:tetratricopeptide repeat protein [bacterium]